MYSNTIKNFFAENSDPTKIKFYFNMGVLVFFFLVKKSLQFQQKIYNSNKKFTVQTMISMYPLSTQTQQKFLEIVSIQSVPCP